MWPWKPPTDPEKPNFPYFPGFEVDIENHSPPPPFGGSNYSRAPQMEIVPDEWLYSVTQTQHIVKHQRMETSPPAQRRTARLTVTKSIAIGNARGAQLILCSVTPHQEEAELFEAVAKVYDPLYYPFVTAFGCHPKDTKYDADRDCSREASAYECLNRAIIISSSSPQRYHLRQNSFRISWCFS